jgi:DNA-binding MarR family transcriptional regulator
MARDDETGAARDARGTDRDRTDDHIARWSGVLPGLDPDIEGAVTRMQALVRHLKRVWEQSLADFDLQRHEYETLHALAGRSRHASPSALARDLAVSPASVTGRLDALEKRGLVRRTPSPEDRRRVDVELTDDGHATWLGALDVVGHEEYRLLGTLTAAERRALSDMMRRVMLRAEGTAGTAV